MHSELVRRQLYRRIQDADRNHHAQLHELFRNKQFHTILHKNGIRCELVEHTGRARTLDIAVVFKYFDKNSEGIHKYCVMQNVCIFNYGQLKCFNLYGPEEDVRLREPYEPSRFEIWRRLTSSFREFVDVKYGHVLNSNQLIQQQCFLRAALKAFTENCAICQEHLKDFLPPTYMRGSCDEFEKKPELVHNECRRMAR
ncbi:hypothetical protein QR680_006833 [Steinernema hermaphroditum]|uniref:Uncharacterized protein n=1 Tax=Steinernema hermaphroditum TaxID=289476 RepID=A0AA39HWL6_9BILA|nr:hypothetical protein QR680_006833 [Steinernema hermaphroditum]